MSAPREEGDTRNARKERTKAAANKPDASVNMDELRELIALLRENDLAELELERVDFRVRLRREDTVVTRLEAAEPAPAVARTAAPVPVHPGQQAETQASEDQDLRIIPSPIVGTFYRSPSPAADPFVKIGSTVKSETVVCIIEAMKLMNEIQAEASGEIVKIYVENGQPVEYGQPLFGIRQ
ncbi:MAG TPA: acetyl-CoA carboxylase biotin carboxyl carrier protein [Pyrinomonadaceae bacterium]|nr:acetyl-CoA carboxylase biotin carboxyl carrier protein [Pyrinomonadaceae bacterium]